MFYKMGCMPRMYVHGVGYGRSENVEDSINYSSFETVSRNAAGWKEEVNG